MAEKNSDETTDAASEAPTEPTDASGDAGAPPSGLRRGVTVPAWLLGVLALVAVGLLGFGIGRWTAPDESESEARGPFPGQTEAGGPQAEPQVPTPIPADAAVLGVGVENSSDPEGAAVVRVLETGPAADAGLETGDVITAVDGDDVADAEQLGEAVRAHDPGDDVTVTYERDGDSNDADVTLVSADSLRPSNDNGGGGNSDESTN